jgi:DNA-binding transcriptional ArsR family regulator
MSYTPRGHVKTILDGMAKDSPELEWTAQELADLAGIDRLTVSSTLRVAVKNEAVYAQRKGREFVYSLTPYEVEAEEPAEPVKFSAAMWDDGDLVIYGAQQTDDGGVLLSKEQLATIKRMVAWSPAP